ncbi:MAG: hypothetical protein KBT02_06870 [Treponema sp.]|nr:hypothetical protein [Candidatus Treponema caballi]
MKKRLSSCLHALKWSKKSCLCCKKLTVPSARIAVLIALLLAATIAQPAAQSMPSLSMPEISGPSMPSMPSLSVGSVSTSDSSSSSSSSSTRGTGLTASSLLGLSSTTGLSTLSALLGSDSDSSLLTSLLGSSSSSDDLSLLTALSGTTLGGTNTTTTVLLTEIIDKLDQLSKQLAVQAGSSTTSSAASSSESTAITASANAPGLIRFRVAGYDILSSFTDLYISTPETNGTFLLTADRTYTADGRRRTETLYMLFTADSPASTSETGAGFLKSYSVTVSLLQDALNTNSFLYRLSQATPLRAEKTGNLVSLRMAGALKADILLQLE